MRLAATIEENTHALRHSTIPPDRERIFGIAESAGSSKRSPRCRVAMIAASLELQGAAVAVSGIQLCLVQQFISVPCINEVSDAVPVKLDHVGHLLPIMVECSAQIGKSHRNQRVRLVSMSSDMIGTQPVPNQRRMHPCRHGAARQVAGSEQASVGDHNPNSDPPPAGGGFGGFGWALGNQRPDQGWETTDA